MAAKPVTVPTWATDANFTNGPALLIGTATKVAPSAGVRAEGHIPETAPGPQHENYDRNLIGAWLSYLSDGALSGAHSIANVASLVALQITHSDLNTASFYAAAGNGASTVAAALVDGGLDVVPGSISNPKGLRVRCQAPILVRDSESYGFCDSAGAPTTPTRSGVQVPLKPMRAHADWVSNGGGDNDYLIVAAAGGQQILFDVPLPNGAIASEVRAGVRRGAGGSGDINLNVYSVAHDTGAAPGVSVASSLGNDATSGTSAVADRLAVSGLSFTQGVANMLRVEINASASGAEDRLYWITVTFADPGPRNF